ncbi:flagellar filament capping protein FliD [bacterium]|nr:flagellar filament capping protein FliD [bacterium]
MPSTTITGLASGIEWADTVELMMQIERQPLQRLIERQDENASKKDAWTSLQGRLETLKSVSNGLDTRNELLKKLATSSDTDTLTVVADSDAISATHSVIVNQLAQAEVEVHDGWADINTTAVRTGSAGQFDYTYGGESHSVVVPAGSTMADLIQLINNDNDNPGVAATYIDDGGETDPIHLVISAQDPGEDNTVTIEDTTNLGGTETEFDSGTFTETQTARNSEIRVNGFPPGSWIERDSNVVTDVIEGITISLKDTNATAVNISIDDDTAAIKQKIKDWAEAYNDVMKEIAAKVRFDAEQEISGVLRGDGQVFRVRSDLQVLAASVIPGLDDDALYENLASIGLKSGAASVLIVNEADLDEALEEDVQAVIDLFVFTQSSTDSSLTYFAKSNKTEGGTYDVIADYDANGDLDPDGNNTIGGYAATVENDVYLVGAEGSPVEGLRIRFDSPGAGPGTATATVQIGTGAAVQASNRVDELTDSIDGLIKIVKDGYQSAIDQIEEQIESYERRLEIKEEQLNRQFMAMETAVSQARNQSSWLSSI